MRRVLVTTCEPLVPLKTKFRGKTVKSLYLAGTVLILVGLAWSGIIESDFLTKLSLRGIWNIESVTWEREVLACPKLQRLSWDLKGKEEQSGVSDIAHISDGKTDKSVEEELS